MSGDREPGENVWAYVYRIISEAIPANPTHRRAATLLAENRISGNEHAVDQWVRETVQRCIKDTSTRVP